MTTVTVVYDYAPTIYLIGTLMCFGLGIFLGYTLRGIFDNEEKNRRGAERDGQD